MLWGYSTPSHAKIERGWVVRWYDEWWWWFVLACYLVPLLLLLILFTPLSSHIYPLLTLLTAYWWAA
jgi:hypothetical protein